MHVATRAAFVGRHDYAYILLSNIESSIQDESGHYFVLLNNRACVDVMCGNVTKETADLLEHANYIVKERYSAIAIQINLLLVYSLLGDITKSREKLLSIEAFIVDSEEDERNLVVHAKYAMLKFHEYGGANIEQEYYQRLLEENATAPDSVIQKILAGEMQDIGRADGQLGRPQVYPRILGYWNPDFRGLRGYFE